MLFNNTKKANSKKEEQPIYTGERVSSIPNEDLKFYLQYNVTTNFLRELNLQRNAMKALELIVDKTADGKMAINTYLRLANQGFKLIVKDKKTGKLTHKYDGELKEFCNKVGANSTSGFDTIIDQLHWSEMMRTGQAIEVTINAKANDIDQVIVIDPITFSEFEYDPKTKKHKLYQSRTDGKKINLYDGNFFWEAHQQKLGRPDGRLMFESAILTTKQFYQLLNDSTQVLNRIGYPRYLATVDMEKFSKVINPSQDANLSLRQHLSSVKQGLSKLQAGSDLALTDDVNVSVVGAGEKGTGLDVRAWFDIIEPLIVNSFLLTPVFLGRLKSGSYALAEIQYQVIVDTINATLRHNSKRMAENVFRLWARVKGYNIDIKFEHNPLDLKEEKIKKEIELMTLEINRRKEEYRYISKDEASINTGSQNGAFDYNDENMFEYLKVQNKNTSDTNDTNNNSNPENTSQDTNENKPESELNNQNEPK